MRWPQWVRRNHPDAPLVSDPLPIRVLVAGTHVGTSVNGPPPVHVEGSGAEAQ